MQLIPLGAHSAFGKFARSSRDDVFLTWESEALRIVRLLKMKEFEIVYPSSSIKAEPVVAVMTCQTEARETTESAHSFIDFLFSPEGQQIAVHNGLRPRKIGETTDDEPPFPSIELLEVEAFFGTWKEVWERHLGPNGSFDYAMKIRAAREGGFE
jgi:sulfate transport system substrate-binding protein